MPKGAVDILIEDHNEAKRLFRDIETQEARREELWTKLSAALQAHVAVEKEIFFPEVRRAMGGTLPEEVEESQREEENENTDKLMELIEMGPSDPEFMDQFREFRDTTLEHAELEERALFPRVQERMNQRQLEEMGRRMEERKQRVLREVGAAAR